jgi:hypothetical protein
MRNNTTSTTNKSPTTETEKVFISLPYINEKAEKTTQKMSKIVNEYFDNTQLIVAFKAPSEIGKCFPYKDKVEDPIHQSLVVYQVKCQEEGCNASYIGKCKRILNSRVVEHETDNEKNESAIHKHKKDTNHHIDPHAFEILDRASNDLKLCYKEMLYIRKYNPTLNKQTNSELFTLIIRNAQLHDSKTRDRDNYRKTNKHN